MKKKNKIDIKRVTIVILFSVLMILWLFKGPIKTFFKEKKKKGTATLYIDKTLENKIESLA